MICSNCGESIYLNYRYYRAGLNGTILCTTDCCYEAFEGFYTKEEIDKTIERHTRNI